MKSPLEDPRIYVQLQQLLLLEAHGRSFSLARQRETGGRMAGRQASRLRGRGLDFDELRSYQAGDDVRDIDWRGSARPRQPQVKIYRQERDRPTLLVIDQRVGMFYGTVHAMKSVVAAQTAALLGWSAEFAGDRVGTLLFDDKHCEEYAPRRSRPQLLRVLAAVAKANQRLHADLPLGDHTALNRALDIAARLARHDHRVVVISDFDGSDQHSREQLAGLARHNELVCLLVHDPSARQALPLSDLVATDGSHQVALNLNDNRQRKRLLALSAGRIERVLGWGKEYGFPCHALTTAEDTWPQLRRLFAGSAGGR